MSSEIPEAAVQAAARVVLEYMDESYIVEDEQGNARKAALKILEATKTLLMAEAWEQGKEAGMLDYYHATNPYRPTP